MTRLASIRRFAPTRPALAGFLPNEWRGRAMRSSQATKNASLRALKSMASAGVRFRAVS